LLFGEVDCRDRQERPGHRIFTKISRHILVRSFLVDVGPSTHA